MIVKFLHPSSDFVELWIAHRLEPALIDVQGKHDDKGSDKDH